MTNKNQFEEPIVSLCARNYLVLRSVEINFLKSEK